MLTGSPSGAPSSLVTSQTSFAPNVKSPLLEPTIVVPASEPTFVCQLIGTVMSAPVVLRRAANVRIVAVDARAFHSSVTSSPAMGSGPSLTASPPESVTRSPVSSESLNAFPATTSCSPSSKASD